MKIEKLILSILKKIETMKEGVIAYSYKTGNAPNSWWEISVSDFDLYMSDKRFKALTKAWHKVATIQKEKIVFICGWMPKEKDLLKLAQEDNLILNID